MAAIKITETQLMLIDLALATAIKYLIGQFDEIKNANEEQLKVLKDNAEKRLADAMNKIKTH